VVQRPATDHARTVCAVEESAAACTPDFFLYDRDRRLAYRGAFDESTPGNGVPVTGALLRAAVDHVLAGEAAPEPRRAPRGAFAEPPPGTGAPVPGALLRAAVDHVLAGEAVPEPHRPSMGCSIK